MRPVPSITVDRNVEEPAYEQIARQIRALVTAGTLPAGVVAAPAPEPAPGAAASLRAELDGLLARMRQAGVPPDDVQRMVNHGLDTTSEPGRESEH
jgi:DNA-binding transcriptional regulator YhcF (GntR family)